jgi:hypothetical protein
MMVPPEDTSPKRKESMKTKATKKPAGKFAVQAGPSGKMQKFSGASPQQPGVTHRTNKAGKGAEFASGGPSGKMQSFTPVKPQKSGVTSQSNSGGGGYAKK